MVVQRARLEHRAAPAPEPGGEHRGALRGEAQATGRTAGGPRGLTLRRPLPRGGRRSPARGSARAAHTPRAGPPGVRYQARADPSLPAGRVLPAIPGARGPPPTRTRGVSAASRLVRGAPGCPPHGPLAWSVGARGPRQGRPRENPGCWGANRSPGRLGPRPWRPIGRAPAPPDAAAHPSPSPPRVTPCPGDARAAGPRRPGRARTSRIRAGDRDPGRRGAGTPVRGLDRAPAAGPRARVPAALRRRGPGAASRPRDRAARAAGGAHDARGGRVEGRDPAPRIVGPQRGHGHGGGGAPGAGTERLGRPRFPDRAGRQLGARAGRGGASGAARERRAAGGWTTSSACART